MKGWEDFYGNIHLRLAMGVEQLFGAINGGGTKC